VRVEQGTPREQEITLVLGGLDPVDTLIGVAQRLHNLGFCGYDGDAEPTEASLIEPLQNFQKANGLEPSGQINDATKAKLKQMHGS
jgi:N-acetylmuramoyl-L-alanine amidase